MRSLSVLLIAASLGAMASPAMAGFSDSYTFLKAVTERDMYKAQTIIRKEGSVAVNTRDSDGNQALQIVASRHELLWVQFLLSNGADVDGRNREGSTALLIASASNFPEAVRVLIAYGARPNIANSRGETALIKAVQNRDVDTVSLLLAAGANPAQSDLTGTSAHDYAQQDRRAGAILKLIENAKPVKTTGTMGPSK